MIRALVLASLLLVGCQDATEHGPCIGAFDEKDPTKVYKVSSRNVVLAIVFVETIVVPAVVVLSEAQCPVAVR